MEGWFFHFSLCLCVFVLLLVKVILFSLNWNNSIVCNFCFTWSIPTCCLLVAFTTTLLVCCLLAFFALAPPIYCMSLTCYSSLIFASSTYAYFRPFYYFHHHHLLGSTPWFKYQTPTCLPSCLPTLSFKLALLLATSPLLICIGSGA